MFHVLVTVLRGLCVSHASCLAEAEPKVEGRGQERNTSRSKWAPTDSSATRQDKPCAKSTQEKRNFIPVGLGDASISPTKPPQINIQSK